MKTFVNYINEAEANSQVWAVDSYDYEGRSVTSTTLYNNQELANKAINNWTSKPYQVKVIGGPIGKNIWKVYHYSGWGGGGGSAEYYANQVEAEKASKQDKHGGGGGASSPTEMPIHTSMEDARKYHDDRQAASQAAYQKFAASEKERKLKRKQESPQKRAEMRTNMQAIIQKLEASDNNEKAMAAAIKELEELISGYKRWFPSQLDY